MTAMARHLDDLGPDFDTRWQRAPRPMKRELIAELRELYLLLEEEDMPLLAGQPKPAAIAAAAPATAGQASLFGETEAAGASGKPRKENPFLPRSVLARLQESQQQASDGLRELMHARPATSHEAVDLERELRLKIGPVVETLIEAHMEGIKSELRVRLRAEMDRLIAEHVRKK